MCVQQADICILIYAQVKPFPTCLLNPNVYEDFQKKSSIVFLYSKFSPKEALQFAICKSYKRNSCRHPDTGNDNIALASSKAGPGQP